MATDDENVTIWLKQEDKDAIKVKMVDFNDCDHKKVEPFMHSWCVKQKKSAAHTQVQNASFKNYCPKLIFSYWQSQKLFCQTIRCFCGKRSDTARNIINQNDVLLSNVKDSLGSGRDTFRSCEKSHSHTITRTGGALWRGKHGHCGTCGYS